MKIDIWINRYADKIKSIDASVDDTTAIQLGILGMGMADGDIYTELSPEDYAQLDISLLKKEN